MRIILSTLIVCFAFSSAACARSTPSTRSPMDNVAVWKNYVPVPHPTTPASAQPTALQGTPATDNVGSTSSDITDMLDMMSRAKAPTKTPLVPAGL